jgi:predicted DNA-binding transcriptional regulator AlpA
MSAATIAPLSVIDSRNGETLEPLLKIEEVSRITGRSHWTLRNDVLLGRIRCIRLGRRMMFEQSEIRRLIEDARNGVAAK